MPFIYTPSLYGFAGALIFLILALISVNAEEWMDTAAWGLLGVAYLLKHIPKLIVFRMLNLVATALLAIGVVLFLIQHLPDISS
jgi:CHASE2 domain-containing sensor protein